MAQSIVVWTETGNGKSVLLQTFKRKGTVWKRQNTKAVFFLFFTFFPRLKKQLLSQVEYMQLSLLLSRFSLCHSYLWLSLLIMFFLLILNLYTLKLFTNFSLVVSQDQNKEIPSDYQNLQRLPVFPVRMTQREILDEDKQELNLCYD